MDGEVRGNIDNCEWYEVYDVIEAVYHSLQQAAEQREYLSEHPPQPDLFAAELNKYFRRNGIGWQLADGEVRIRGDQSFEYALRQATRVLDDEGRSTAGEGVARGAS